MLQRWLNDRPEIVSHDIVTRAMHRAKTDDFGGASWTEPLEVLTRSLHRDAHLTFAGRRRVRSELVALLAGRAPAGRPVADRPGDPVVFVLGLDGSGATDLAARLVGGPATGADTAFESTFASLAFEERWHLPSYAEWLAEADLDAAYHDARSRLGATVVTGAGHLERLPAVRAAFPDAVIVHVDRDPDACITGLVDRIVTARRRDSDDVEPGKVERYWSWRTALLVERNRAQRDALADAPGLVELTHEQVANEPDAAVALVTAASRG